MPPFPRVHVAFLALLIVALACNVPVPDGGSPPPTALLPDATKITLEIQGTAMAQVLTRQAPEATQQLAQATTQAPAPAATTEAPVTAQPTSRDVQALIRNAKILVYEDAAATSLGKWVKSTLDLMGLKYVHVGDAIGDFMSDLNSSTHWDLIIVAAESRKGV